MVRFGVVYFAGLLAALIVGTTGGALLRSPELKELRTRLQQAGATNIAVRSALDQSKRDNQVLKTTIAELQASMVASKKPSNWSSQAPNQAWCYQERNLALNNQPFSVYCNWSQDRCNEMLEQNGSRKLRTVCQLATDLSRSGWKPKGGGALGSWFQEKLDQQLGPPFPAFSGN
jgi:hypothetical protein